MTEQTDIKDPFLTLLTEALRAGPASAEWHEAVAQLKSAGANGQSDEYRLLINAREALESGKDYRSVRAGVGFTRKLLGQLENETSATRRPFPLLGFITAIAVVVILGIVSLVLYQIHTRAPASAPSRSSVEDLAGTYFPTEIGHGEFTDRVPDGWREIGSLPIRAADGLRAGVVDVPRGQYVGGGLVLAGHPLPPAQAFAAVVTLGGMNASDTLIPQIFISNSPDFSADRATATQELVWQAQGAQQQVIVNGRVEHQAPLPAHAATLTIRIVCNRDAAIIECDGKRLWAGANALGNQNRYLGVRFISASGDSDQKLHFQSVRIDTN